MTTKHDSLAKKLNRAIREPFDKKKSLKRLEEYHSMNRELDEVVDWALNFGGGGGLYRVKTLQKRSEILELATMVKQLNPSIILEIGTERGGTLFIWAAIASTMAISCDIQTMERQRELFSKFPPKHSACEVVLITGDSHSQRLVQSVDTVLKGELVDFLFIDGDHTEVGVEQDFEMYKHFVRKGGYIAFHDIVDNQPLKTNEVQHFWRRLKEQYEYFELIDNPSQCGYGIGVVRI